MASTYTVNIGIEKPGTGDQSGTWGNTTNTNFDIIDQATNGVATVTLAVAGTSGSPNTLLINNGALSDGRNRFIEFNDGADLGATAYVQLDPNDAEKIVHIRNSLSGSRSLILFQGTYNASNDFEVENGHDVLVKFDGGGTGATVTQVLSQVQMGGITSDGGTIKLDGNYPVGTNNVALGDTALDSVTSGNNNTAIGNIALTANTSGGGNTAIGTFAVAQNSTGASNTGVGNSALYRNTSGNYNVAVGESSLEFNTTANNNTAVGYVAGYSNSTGADNTAVGFASMQYNTTAGSNSAYGSYGLRNNTTGQYNTALGSNSLYYNTTASYNTAVGYQAGYSNTTGYIQAFGSASLYANTTGTQNAAFGANALQLNTTGSSNTALGNSTLLSNTTASYNTAVGHQAGYTNTTGYENTLIGFQAGYLSTTARAITAVGYTAGYSVTTAQYGCFVGRGAGASVTTGTANNFFGANASAFGAGYYVTTGAKNTILGGFDGNQSGLDIRTSSNNIVLSDGDGTPRLFINSNGSAYIGTVTAATNTRLQANGSSGYFASTFVNLAGSQAYGVAISSGTGEAVYFYHGGTIGAPVGSIATNASSTSYNTSSDYRLKENVADLTGAADRVQQLAPKRFNFIVDADTTVDGFLAHEVQSVVPEAVTGTKDAVDDDGNIVAQAIDQSKLVPLLTAALQEALTKIDDLEARIAALES